MIKLIGAAAIVIAASGIGFYKARCLEKRLSTLVKAARMLGEIKIALNYSLMTTEDIITFLETNSSLKQLAEQRNGSISCLSERENQLLADFWAQLGSSDLESQLSSADMYIAELEEDISEIRESKEAKCRLYRTMGILSGLFICIMLI